MEQSPLPNLGPCQLWPHQNWQLITTAQWTHKTHRVYTLASFCLAAHSSSDAHEQAQHRRRQVLNKSWKESRRIFHCPTIVSKLLRFRHSEMIVFVGSTTFTARRWSKRNNRRNPFLARRFQFISCRKAMRAFFDRSSFPFSHLNWRDLLYFHNRNFFLPLRLEATLSGIADFIRFQYWSELETIYWVNNIFTVCQRTNLKKGKDNFLVFQPFGEQKTNECKKKKDAQATNIRKTLLYVNNADISLILPTPTSHPWPLTCQWCMKMYMTLIPHPTSPPTPLLKRSVCKNMYILIVPERERARSFLFACTDGSTGGRRSKGRE